MWYLFLNLLVNLHVFFGYHVQTFLLKTFRLHMLGIHPKTNIFHNSINDPLKLQNCYII